MRLYQSESGGGIKVQFLLSVSWFETGDQTSIAGYDTLRSKEVDLCMFPARGIKKSIVVTRGTPMKASGIKNSCQTTPEQHYYLGERLVA